MSRRVVITGLGAVTGFGYGTEALWDGLIEGRSAIRRISRFDPSGFRCQAGAEALDFKVREHVPKSYRKATKVMARDIELAVGAAKAALEDAGVITPGTADGETPTYESSRIGCQIGAGLIAADISELSMALATAAKDGQFDYDEWGRAAMGNLTPLWLLKYLPNMLACHVTIIHDAQGPSNTITCAEASGLLSIGESRSVIQRGDADLCFSGGAESKLNHMGLIRMDIVGRLAHVSIDAEDEAFDGGAVVRPYATDATGSVLGEAGGIVLLEAHDTAVARGARMYAEAIGFGAGHSPASDDPAERAEGMCAAIENALEEAGIDAADIDAIVPHGSGCPTVDAEEAAAFDQVFGSRLAEIPLITTTPNVGDVTAAVGGLAACVGALAIRNQTIPARLNAGSVPGHLQAGAAACADAKLDRVLVCTGSLGGQNAALILQSI